MQYFHITTAVFIAARVLRQTLLNKFRQPFKPAILSKYRPLHSRNFSNLFPCVPYIPIQCRYVEFYSYNISRLPSQHNAYYLL